METIRTLLTAAFLAAVTLGAYYYINTPAEDREKALAALFGQTEDAQSEGQNTPPPFESTYNPSNDFAQNSTVSSEYSEKSSNFSGPNTSNTSNLSNTLNSGSADSLNAAAPIPVNPFASSDSTGMINGSPEPAVNPAANVLPGLPDVALGTAGTANSSGPNPIDGADEPYSSPDIGGPAATVSVTASPVAGSIPESGTPGLPPEVTASTALPVPPIPASQTVESMPASNAPIASAVGTSAANVLNPGYPSNPMTTANPMTNTAEQQNRAIVRDFLAKAQEKIQQRDLLSVLIELSKWYNNPNFTPEEKLQVNRMLMRLAGEVIYLHPEKYLTQAYTVQPGDTITSLANKYQVPWQFLAKINGLQAPFHLPSGTSLKVIKGPFNAQVNMEHFEMTLWLPLSSDNPNETPRSLYAGTFHIGLGQDTAQLAGDYIVEAKTLDPEYRGAEAVFAPTDPNNPYGSRLIKLVQYGGNPNTPRIGIHGTNNSANIRQLSPHGNICLDARDINDLFDILSVGSRVLVQEREE